MRYAPVRFLSFFRSCASFARCSSVCSEFAPHPAEVPQRLVGSCWAVIGSGMMPLCGGGGGGGTAAVCSCVCARTHARAPLSSPPPPPPPRPVSPPSSASLTCLCRPYVRPSRALHRAFVERREVTAVCGSGRSERRKRDRRGSWRGREEGGGGGGLPAGPPLLLCLSYLSFVVEMCANQQTASAS